MIDYLDKYYLAHKQDKELTAPRELYKLLKNEILKTHERPKPVIIPTEKKDNIESILDIMEKEVSKN